MLKQVELYYLNERLKEIMGNNRLFGGLAILMVGDIGQLPPVQGKVLWDHKCSGDEAKAHFLYNMFDVISELTENVRLNSNDEDAVLYDGILKRMHDGNNTNEDAEIINKMCSRHRMREKAWSESGFRSNDAIHLFVTNREVDQHNKRMLLENGNPIALIRAKHTCTRAKLAGPRDTMNLDSSMYLARGASVLINNNLCSSVVNGSRGIVKDIVYEEGKSAPELPTIVWTEIDTYKGPSYFPGDERRKNGFLSYH